MEYEFRVIAKNRAGKGDPSKASEIAITRPKAGYCTKAYIIIQVSHYYVDVDIEKNNVIS